MKVFKTYSGAKKFNGDAPIVRVGPDTYLAFPKGTTIPEITSIDVIMPNGRIEGTSTLRSLTSLGNVNHAASKAAQEAFLKVEAGELDTPFVKFWKRQCPELRFGEAQSRWYDSHRNKETN